VLFQPTRSPLHTPASQSAYDQVTLHNITTSAKHDLPAKYAEDSQASCPQRRQERQHEAMYKICQELPRLVSEQHDTQCGDEWQDVTLGHRRHEADCCAIQCALSHTLNHL